MTGLARTGWRRAAALCAALALAAAGSAPSQPVAPPATLAVAGDAVTALTFDLAALRRLPVREFEDVRQLRGGQTSAAPEQVRRYSGVLLRDVIAAARPVERQRHDLRQSIVIATAADGYRAIFSWSELFLSPIGDGALVVLERDGAPLPADEGPLALVSLRDANAGPRHVKWLSRIELRRVSD